MKKYTNPALIAVALALLGCATPQQPLINPNGQPMKFVNPVLGKGAMSDARYVLLEKSISDGKYKVVSISKARPIITNERQERIAFNKELTGFAPDFTDYSFTTYTDQGNYGVNTVVMRCTAIPRKMDQYGPCNSTFSGVFVPTGVMKDYVAGRISQAQKDQWEKAKNNPLREVSSPEWALKQANVFDRMPELVNAQ